MKKIVSITAVSLVFLSSTLCLAETCKSSYSGKEFFAVSVSDGGGASCSYRYCYYGCIYDSYSLSGHYQPSKSTLSYWQKEDYGYSCYEDSSSCEFVAR